MVSFLLDLDLYENRKATNYLSITKIDGGYLFHNKNPDSHGTSFITNEEVLILDRKIMQADQVEIFDTAVVLNDLNALISEINRLSQTDVHGTSFTDGEIISPGVYSVTGAAGTSGTQTFDAQGDPDALFVIRVAGTLSFGASNVNVLTGGARASNIFWVANGALGFAGGVNLKGTIIATTGGAAPGSGFTLEGRLLSTGGGLTITTGNCTVPSDPTSLPLLSLEGFTLFTSSGNVGNAGGGSIYNGDIAANLGSATGFASATVNGEIFPTGKSYPLQNNYLPQETGAVFLFNEATAVSLFPEFPLVISGFEAFGFGNNQTFKVSNFGIAPITLLASSSFSLEDNRFSGPSDIVVDAFTSVCIDRINATINKFIILS